MKALTVMQTWGRTTQTIHSASSLDCSISLWVLRKALSLSAFPMLGFLSTLCSSQEPSSVRSCQTEIYLAKHAQLLCLPTKGFTQPVMQVTRTRMQGCLLLCSAAAPQVPVQNRHCTEHFCSIWTANKQTQQIPSVIQHSNWCVHSLTGH